MSLPLLSTKFHAPPLRDGAVARPRLTIRIREGIGLPGVLVLLSCPPGFGKTTLLSEFVSGFDQRVAWVSLDEGDNDPLRFWEALIAACQTVHPGLGSIALGMLPLSTSLPPQTLPTLLANDLAALEENLVLILDDYHVIQEPAIHEGLGFLIEHLPERLHPVIATRIDPPWSLPRFRARGRLAELRAADLRFNNGETSAFFKDTMDLDLLPRQAAALEARTEGWAASLQLAALSLKGRQDTDGFIQAFTGSQAYLAEYLMEEALKNQPAALQSFLLKTSILEGLSAGLCGAVTGQPEARGLLDALLHRNLFLIPLDETGSWYRYHHLFADLLRARLRQTVPPSEVHALHRLAADWYEAAGLEREAIPHSLAAADPDHALRMLERIAMPMILNANFTTVEGWLKALPSGILDKSPRTRLAAAWMYLVRRDPRSAAGHMAALEDYFSRAGSSVDDLLQGQWLALRSMLAGAQGQASESRDLAARALELLPEGNAQLRSVALSALAEAHLALDENQAAAEVFKSIIREGERSGDLATEILGSSRLSLMMVNAGELHEAYDVTARALRRLEQAEAYAPFSATLYGEMATIFYHWNRIEEARGFFSRSVELSLPGGFNDAQVYHHVFLSRLAQAEGDLSTARNEIDLALKQMRASAPGLVREEVIAQQVSVALAQGCLEEAKEALGPHGFGFELGFTHPPLPSGEKFTHAVGLLYISALRILAGRGKEQPEDVQYGLQLADLLLTDRLRERNLPIAVQALLLRARLHALRREARLSQADTLEALGLAAPEKYISIFLEEGEPAANLLREVARNKPLKDLPGHFLKALLGAFHAETALPAGPHAAEDGLIEPLTRRELEVLRLIAAGDSNQEIAGKLVITLSAVKKHTGNIFRKLAVNSRTLAAVRARKLGLLESE